MTRLEITAEMVALYMADNPGFAVNTGDFAEHGSEKDFILDMYGSVENAVKVIRRQIGKGRKDKEAEAIASLLRKGEEEKPQKKGWYIIFLQKNPQRPYLRYWDGRGFRQQRSRSYEPDDSVIAWKMTDTLRD